MADNPHRCIVDDDDLYVDFVRMTDIYGNPLSEPDGRPLEEGERLVDTSPPDKWPQGPLRAKLVEGEWAEAANSKEIEEARKALPDPPEVSKIPTTEQRLKAAEDAIMALAMGGISIV